LSIHCAANGARAGALGESFYALVYARYSFGVDIAITLRPDVIIPDYRFGDD